MVMAMAMDFMAILTMDIIRLIGVAGTILLIGVVITLLIGVVVTTVLMILMASELLTIPDAMALLIIAVRELLPLRIHTDAL